MQMATVHNMRPSARGWAVDQSRHFSCKGAVGPLRASATSTVLKPDAEARLEDRGVTASHPIPTTSVLEAMPTTTSDTPVASTSGPARSGSKFVVDENEILVSTLEHQMWTFGCIAMLTATLASSMAAAADTGAADLALTTGIVGIAYVLSDLGTGIYHWGVDNYGDGSTPVFGRQIAAFQGHHQRPWTITQRQFCNNVHQVFKPASVPASLILLSSAFLPHTWNAFASSFLLLVCMSQQFHAWGHMKKSELHPAVLALQDAGVLISRKAHGAHHCAPFEGNYCIVSGLWNPLLDNSLFFRKLEDVVFAWTGVEPRCWHDPPEGWQELTRSELMQSSS